nr:putative lineage-restricted protein [Crepidula fornicata]
MGVRWLFFVLLVAAAWVCGCFAQAQAEVPALAIPKGPLNKKFCAEIMDILERKLYTSYRPNLPTQALEKAVPILVATLLPLKCQQSGRDAITTTQPQQDLAHVQSFRRLSRPKRNIFSLLMGGAFGQGKKVKDPGDHPPPGMTHNPFKDPGDRPMTLFGMPVTKVKDPGDRPPPPPGEAGPANPMGGMMSMLRMISISRMFAAMANGGRRGGGGGGGPSQG